MTYGRLTGACWLKLERSGNNVIGSISADGANWTQVASAAVSMPRRLSAGLFASSGLEHVTTRIVFDHVSVSTPLESRQH